MAFDPFAGFEYFKSSDVQAAEQQQFELALQSGDKNQMRMALGANLGKMLAGGSPEYKKAKKTEEILQTAFDTAKKADDDIVAQQNYMRQVQRLAIEADLPEIAMQATTNLSALLTSQEERDRLKSAEQRAQAKERRDQGIYGMEEERHEQETEKRRIDIEKAKAEQKFSSRRLLWDPETQQVIKAYYVDDKDDVAEIARKQQENPRLRLTTPAEVFGLEKDLILARERWRAAGADGGDTMGDRRYMRFADDQLPMLGYSSRVATLIGDNPDLFTTAAGIKGWAENVAVEGRALVGKLYEGGHESFEERIKSNPNFQNIRNAEKRALVMNFAYALATAREGGRLTDQDIDRAIISLGLMETPDPRAILQVLLDNALGAAEVWERRSRIDTRKDRHPETYRQVGEIYRSNIREITRNLIKLGGAYDFEAEKDRLGLKPRAGTATKVDRNDGDNTARRRVIKK